MAEYMTNSDESFKKFIGIGHAFCHNFKNSANSQMSNSFKIDPQKSRIEKFSKKILNVKRNPVQRPTGLLQSTYTYLFQNSLKPNRLSMYRYGTCAQTTRF